MLVAEALGWPFVRDPLATLLSRQTGRTVQLSGEFRLHLWRGLRMEVAHLSLAQPRWMQPSDGASAPMLEATQVTLQLPLRKLLEGVSRGHWQSLHIDSLRMQSLRLDLWHDAQGRANWRFTADGQETEPGGVVRTRSSREEEALPYIGELGVREGQLTCHDVPGQWHMAAAVRTDEGMARTTGGTGLAVAASGRFKGNAFTLSLSASGFLPLLRHQQPAEQVPIRLDAQAGPSVLSFEGTSQDVLRLRALDGRVHARGPSMSFLGDVLGMTLPVTAAFDLTGHVRKDGMHWWLQESALSVGASRLGGDFEWQQRPQQPPLLRGELRGSRLALQDLGPSFGVPAKGATVPAPPPGKVLPAKQLDVSSLRAMEAEVRVRLQRVTLGRFFQQPMTPLHADLTLRGGVLTLANLDTATASGGLQGDVRMDARASVLRWQAHLRWRDIRLERSIHAPNHYARHAAMGYVSGKLAGRATLTGHGNSVAALMASLDGEVLAWIEQGRVSRLLTEAIDLHLLEALGLVLTGDEFTNLRCGVARLQARGGVLRPDPVVVDTGASALLVSGGIALADERLKLTVISAPRHPTVLSLRSPIDIGGTFSNPRVGLRGQAIGVKALSAIVLGSVVPLAALLPLMDPGASAPDCRTLLQGGR